MTTFAINPKALEAVSLAMSTDETRYYVCGVHLTISSARADAICYEATNGHQLYRAWAEPEKGTEMPAELDAIVPASAVKRIVAYAKENKHEIGKGKWLTANIENGFLTVTHGKEIVLGTVLIDGTYPDTDKVTPPLNPKRKVPDSVGFNLDYMASIAKAVKLATGERIATVRLNDPASPSRFEAKDFLAVLMPCRV